jgi:hypothetical protein
VGVRYQWGGGAMFGHISGGGRFGAKSLKPSHWGSVSDTPLNFVAEGDGGKVVVGYVNQVIMAQVWAADEHVGSCGLTAPQYGNLMGGEQLEVSC